MDFNGYMSLLRNRSQADGGRPMNFGDNLGLVDNVTELSSGELISIDSLNRFQRWQDGKPIGNPISTKGMISHRVSSMVGLRNGDLITAEGGGLFGSGNTSTLRRWRDGMPTGDTDEILTEQRESLRC